MIQDIKKITMGESSIFALASDKKEDNNKPNSKDIDSVTELKNNGGKNKESYKEITKKVDNLESKPNNKKKSRKKWRVDFMKTDKKKDKGLLKNILGSKQAKKDNKTDNKNEKKPEVKEEKTEEKEEKTEEKKTLFTKKTDDKKEKFDQSEMEVVKEFDDENIDTEDIEKLDFPNIIEPHGDMVFEKKGFGWKGLGSRKIFYDKKFKEYRYKVIEPVLNEKEREIKDKIIHLFRVRADVDVFETNDDKKKLFLEESLDKIIENNNIELTRISKDKIFYYIMQDFIGYGKIDIMMKDEGIEDISCDGHGIPIFIYHKVYESIKSNVYFLDAEELTSFVVKLSQMCGKQISVYEPVVDGKLSDGSRLQTTLGKTITQKSTFTIRRFREDPLTPVDLIQNNTMSLDMAAYFWLVIEHGASVLFCGGTASGKTTMLNALSLFLPSAYKIVSVEDTREINLPHENWIAGTTRTGFSSSESSKTGKDIDMFDLIRVALRQRPKAIIVGEVRGKEAYSLFQAMTTGHLSYSTVHASDMHTLIQRLESPPIELPRALLTSLDLVVFLNNLTVDKKPVRRITNVTEIIKLDPETNRLVTMSPFSWVSELEDRFEKTRGSVMYKRIKFSNNWNDNQLENEIKNRKKVLEWLMKKNLRSYKNVGKVISYYHKDPEMVLKRVKEEK